jgi:hypothetical protein
VFFHRLRLIIAKVIATMVVEMDKEYPGYLFDHKGYGTKALACLRGGPLPPAPPFFSRLMI